MISDIEYNLVTKNGKKIYSAEPLKIRIPLSARIIGNYALSEKGKSIIAFVDVNEANAQMEFKPINVEVVDTIIKTGLFINNEFKEQKDAISIVKGLHANLAFEITNFKNQSITLEMNNTDFIKISKVEAYSITNLKDPIKTLNISDNTFTITDLPTDKTHYVLVFKATAINLGTNINDVIKINGFLRNERHTINIVKLLPLQ